jgi:Flp pilus assembly protein CpaB
MSKYRWLTLLLVPLAVGFFVLDLLTRPPKPRMVPVIVARGPVLQGTFLNPPERFFESRLIAEHRVPLGAIRDMNELRHKIVLKTMDAGAFVHEGDVGEYQRARGLPRSVRAVAVRVQPDEEVIPPVIPGMYVDLIHERWLADGKIIWTPVAENVMVLAWSREDSPAEGSRIAVLALTPAQTERVNHCSQGEIRLIRHQPPDNDRALLRE